MSNENILKCPVCDKVISDFEESISDPCEHVMLTYVDILSGEFVHVNDAAKEIEEDIMARYEYLNDNGDDLCIDEVMVIYADENEGYEVIEMTTSGLACGPVSSTEYHLIKTA